MTTVPQRCAGAEVMQHFSVLVDRRQCDRGSVGAESVPPRISRGRGLIQTVSISDGIAAALRGWRGSGRCLALLRWGSWNPALLAWPLRPPSPLVLPPSYIMEPADNH
jgi:hypothetical protein